MRPSLYLLKKQIGRTEVAMKTEVQVVVVDLDRSKDYPLNCLYSSPKGNITVEAPKYFQQDFWKKQFGSC
jgi:hypothetical protein